MSTDTGDAGTTIQEYSKTAAALADLRQRYASAVFDVTTAAGMKSAVAARAELRGYRTSLEKLRKEIKAPALARCNAIDTEAKRITMALTALEEPIDVQIKREEDRREQERQARIAAEQARVDAIQSAINGIRGAITVATGQPSAWIAEILEGVRAAELTVEQFAEFLDNAKAARADTIEALEKMLRAAEAQEAEALRIKEEREELARLRAAEEARQAAERERMAAEEAEARARRDAEDRAAAEQRAQAEAQARAEREAAEREAAAARAEQERQIAEQRAALAAEAAELRRQIEQQEAAARQQREEAERAERARQEQAESAERARRAHILANTEIDPLIYDLLQRCEAFVSVFEDDGPPEAPYLLADLRAALRAGEWAKVAA